MNYLVYIYRRIHAFLQKLGDIEDNLNGFNVSVRDQKILDQDTKDGLKNLSKSGVNNINFEQFFSEVYILSAT